MRLLQRGTDVRRRAELCYEQLDALVPLRQQARRKVLAEKNSAWKFLRSIPALSPIRSSLLVALVQPQDRIRTKRPIWKYSESGVMVHTSADHRCVEGQLERSKKSVSVRGLDPNHNHHLKDLFRGAAIQAATREDPFREFYENLVAKGIRPQMVRLALPRTSAAITLSVWRKGIGFDAEYLKPQTA